MAHTVDDLDAAAALGAAVRRFRRGLKMSQEHFAQISGIDRSYVGQIERGEVNVTVDTLLRLGRGLGRSASELLHEAGL